jgi:hypothetical protein
MNSYIVEFEQGSLKISQSIELLYGLMQSLEDTEENWIDRFRSEWWTLALLYLVVLENAVSTSGILILALFSIGHASPQQNRCFLTFGVI